jgi:small subunit ribosomal protein S17
MVEVNNVQKERSFEGLVVSDKMDKTIVVLVESFKMHPIYKKRFKVSKRYKVHSENNEAKVGNVVRFIECRPLSKDKRWRLVEILRVK